MMLNKIMVPYDGSEHADHAFAYAKALAADLPGVKIVVVHAIPSGIFGLDELGTSGSIDGVPLGMLENAKYAGVLQPAIDSARQKVIEHLGDAFDSSSAAVSVEVVAGSSATNALADYAEEQGVDLIIMGRRGLGAIRGMIGSVSSGILHATDIAVLTVK